MREQQYSVDDLIQFLEAIPDALWYVGAIDAGHGRHCAIGHCYTISGQAAYDLDKLCIDNHGYSAAEINDNHSRFRQPTPKLRILNALYEIKSKQIPTPPALVLAPAWPTIAMQVKPVEVLV